MSLKDAQEVLMEELEEAKQQLIAVDRQLQQNRPDFGPGIGSPDIAIWEMNLVRKTTLEARITEIEDALEQCSSGSYGMCEICGAIIDPERLRILPHTTRCVRCAGHPHGLRAESRSKLPA